MNDIFGIPVTGLMVVLVATLALALLAIAAVALRRPVIFKLGVRNLPRRKAQTALIVVGLMLSTMIISAALGTGETLHYSLTNDTYTMLGQVDELVVASPDYEAPNIDTSARIDEGTLTTVEQTLTGNPAVDGVLPLLDVHVSAVNQTSQQGEPDLVLVGADPARLSQFGGLRDTNGNTIDLTAMGVDQVVLSEEAADALDATAGDAVTVYYQQAPHILTVAAIAEDTYLSGYRRGREDMLEYPGMVMPLAAVQSMTGLSGQLSAVAISNTGDAKSGVDHTDAVLDALRPVLTGTGIGVDTVKRAAVDDNEQLAGMLTGIFLVLGLFSVMAGLLLIVLIFTMLAAERRSEMGMARAVGTQRGQLMQQFVSEGAAYALVAGLVGSGLGVLSSFGIARAMGAIFGQYAQIEPHFDPRGVVIAYALGVVVTIVTIVIASWKVSRLNVVAAIRDLPETSTAHRSFRALLGGLVLLAAGGFMTMAGHSGGTAFLFYTGMSLLPFGVAVLLRFAHVPSRLVYSLVGVYILGLWLLPRDTADRLFGELDGSGDIQMFFISGIFMVIGATLLTMQNTDLLLAAVGRLSRLFTAKAAAIRIAVAYPAATRGRTGMTIAMFSLIIFSLVMMATMNANYDTLYGGDEATAGWHVRADIQGGNTIPDFIAALDAAGVDTSVVTATGVTTNPNPFSSSIRLSGDEAWKAWAVLGMDASFITESDLTFQARADGYESDAAIIAALQSTPNVAVIDASAIPQGGFGGDDDAFELTDLSDNDETFAPIVVELAAPDGSVHQVTVIGVIDQALSSLSGLYAAQPTIDAIYPQRTWTSYYVALGNAGAAGTTAKAIEAALFEQGVQGIAISDEVKEMQKENTGFLYLIEGFMGLGLVVGVAAVGVIAFRSVVERRQQIGVLRALGFQKSIVSLGFLIETGFIVAIGSLTGTVLGIVLSRNLFTSEVDGSSGASFMVPWMLVGVILVATVAAAMAMTWLPSRQAGGIAPAEALRYE